MRSPDALSQRTADPSPLSEPLLSLDRIADAPTRRRFSIELCLGDHLAVVGRLRAGKTALLEMLAGRRKPLHGTLKGGGTVVTPRIQKGWHRATPQTIAAQNHKSGGLEVVSEVLSALQLWEVRKKPFSSLDDRQRQACALLPVVLGEEQIALLDESLDKLDPWAARDFIFHLKNQKPASVVATNSLWIAEQFGSIIAMKLGRAVYKGSIGQLIEESGLVRMNVERNDPSSVSALVDPVRVQIEQEQLQTRTTINPNQDSAVTLLAKGYGSIHAAVISKPTLFEALDRL